MSESKTPKTMRCWRDGKWHADELANLSAKLESELQQLTTELAQMKVEREALRDNSFDLLNFIRFLEASGKLSGTMKEGSRIMSLKVRADELIKSTMESLTQSHSERMVPWSELNGLYEEAKTHLHEWKDRATVCDECGESDGHEDYCWVGKVMLLQSHAPKTNA